MRRLFEYLLFALGMAALLGVALWLRSSRGAGGEPPARPPYRLPVTLGDVRRGDVQPRVQLTGSVLPWQRAQVGFELDGRIAALERRAGDPVEAGELLARLDARDQEAELARARAAAELERRELERLLAGSRAEEIRRLEATLVVAKAEAELARKEVERGRELVGNKVINESRFDTLIAQNDAAEGRVRAAEETLAEARAGTRAEELEVQRARVAVAEADVALAQRELDKTVLNAPFDGAVVARLAAVGDAVASGQPLFELVDTTRREVALEIPSAWVGRLGNAPEVALTLEEDPDFRLVTRLDTVIAAADEASRNFRGLARLEPEEESVGLLRPGMFVRAELALEPVVDALVVDADALRTVPQGTIVVRAAPVPAGTPGGSEGAGPPPAPFVAEWIPVRVLGADAAKTAVLPLDPERALAPGDRVVLTGVDLAYPGVALMPSGPSGPGAGSGGGSETAQHGELEAAGAGATEEGSR